MEHKRTDHVTTPVGDQGSALMELSELLSMNIKIEQDKTRRIQEFIRALFDNEEIKFDYKFQLIAIKQSFFDKLVEANKGAPPELIEFKVVSDDKFELLIGKGQVAMILPKSEVSYPNPYSPYQKLSKE